MILRARCIFPLTAAPVDNGAVVIQDGRIQWLGRWRDCPNPEGEVPLDLGEVALMPGLINTHCHLDYTSMAGQIPPPKTFPDWVKNILSFKAHWSFSEFAESWLKGARMLLQSGTTTVADTETVPELPPETWKSTPLRMVSFFEMTGVKSQRSPDEILADALEWIDRWPRDDRKSGGLSPHALYSTVPALLRASVRTAEERNLPLSIHLAESEAEHQMFVDAAGPFYDWLKGQRKMDDCGQVSPIQLANRYGLLTPRTLVIHANYLAPGDVETLAQSGATVVHCPSSHDYFNHAPFRYEELTRSRVNVCLATDSLASTRKSGSHLPELNLWHEMQLFAQRHPGIAPRQVLAATTTHAAAALHRQAEIGSIQPGAWADLAALTYSGRIDEARVSEELLYQPSVRNVFISGEHVHSVPA